MEAMSIFNDPITLVALAIATFAGFKLWQVLGHSGGASTDRTENLVPQNTDLELKAVEQTTRVIWDGFAEKESVLAKTLQSIADKDTAFDTAQFIHLAQHVHEQVVNAFADGDLVKLGALLTPPTYEVFATEIANRKAQGQIVIFKFIRLVKSNLKSAELIGSEARLAVVFTTEVVSALKDAKGLLISGDEKAISRVEERWTFNSDLSQSQRQWRLTETHDAD